MKKDFKNFKDYNENGSSLEDPARAENSNENGVSIGTATNSKYIRLRDFPSPKAAVITYLANGDKAEIIERGTNYYKVKVEATGEIGYVDIKYFKED